MPHMSLAQHIKTRAVAVAQLVEHLAPWFESSHRQFLLSTLRDKRDKLI